MNTNAGVRASIIAPISGRIGSTAKTKGNYVKAGGDPLVSIVQLSPIRVRFSVSNREVLDVFGGDVVSRRDAASVSVALANGKSLSVYAQLGCVMLIGLSAKNAILMVEFAKQEREAGSSAVDASLRGVDLRYRAVMMTAWSFIIGVLPLVFAHGAGAGAMRGIGICTCCGMLAATLFGILFAPVLYVLFEGIRGNGTRS